MSSISIRFCSSISLPGETFRVYPLETASDPRTQRG